MRLTLTTRLLAWHAIILVALIGVLIYVFFNDVKPNVRLVTESTLYETAQLLAQLAERDPALFTLSHQGSAASVFAAFDQKKGAWEGLNFYITDAKGMVIYASDMAFLGQDFSQWRDVHLTLKNQYGARSTRLDPDNPDSSVMYVAAPISKQKQIIGVLTVYKANLTILPIITAGQMRIAYWGIALVMIIIILTFFSRYWVRTAIDLLTDYAYQIVHVPTPPAPKLHTPELDVLVNTLTHMRQELDGKSTIERYIHGLTHELKSPLTAINASVEIVQDAEQAVDRRHFLTLISTQTARMQTVIERLLCLARLESQGATLCEALEVNHITQQLCHGLAVSAAQRKICCHYTDIMPCWLKGDAFLLSLALSNLIENAIDFSEEEHQIIITGQRQTEGYLWEIKDFGCGIPEFAQPHIFNRFYSLPRQHKSKSSGLGLALVQEIARLHHGSITVENHAQGGVLARFKVAIAE